jgi:hypothetical protein
MAAIEESTMVEEVHVRGTQSVPRVGNHSLHGVTIHVRHRPAGEEDVQLCMRDARAVLSVAAPHEMGRVARTQMQRRRTHGP